MLNRDQIEAASRLLHGHWRAGTKIGALEDAMRPRSRTQAYEIQAELQRYSRERLFGWKIAATSEAGQRHINVAGPLAGRILAETVLPDGGTAAMAGNTMRVAEPEFAFRMGKDLPPRATPYSVAEVLPALPLPRRAAFEFVVQRQLLHRSGASISRICRDLCPLYLKVFELLARSKLRNQPAGLLSSTRPSLATIFWVPIFRKHLWIGALDTASLTVCSYVEVSKLAQAILECSLFSC
jgi:hypothetical protein